jgi:hypothetical protein
MDKKRDINKTSYGWYQPSCDDPYIDIPSSFDMTVKYAPSQAENATPDWAGPHSYTPSNKKGGNPNAGKS